jgi:hypothetical protein
LRKVKRSKLQPGVRILSNRWVYKRKRNQHNEVVQYKARIVARGFLQQQGLEYDETYAAVCNTATMRLLLAIAAYYDLEIFQVDVDTAYLNATRDRVIYMECPEGFDDGEYVCEVTKSLYRLKQSARQWCLEISGQLAKHGFKPSAADPCMFVNGDIKTGAIITIYVDDVPIIGQQGPALAAKKLVMSPFKCKDLGDIARAEA